MKPAQLAKSGTESGHQRAVFCWAAYAGTHGFECARAWLSDADNEALRNPDHNAPRVPELKWLHHIPNGGSRGDDERSRMIRGNALKAEGVRTGVSDLCLPVKRGQWSGLYIEMKKPKGVESPEQKEFGAFVVSQGFGYVVCDTWQKAIGVIEDYLSWTN
jgi:hypothetical protein